MTTLNELIPTYGNWGGPGWSAGNRSVDGDIDWSRPGIDSLDELFKAHDLAYSNAEHNPDPSTAVIEVLIADIVLLNNMISLADRPDSLYGKLYQPLAIEAFTYKSFWDMAQVVTNKVSELGKNFWDRLTSGANPDTDGDGLPDGVDPNPLTPDSGRSNGFPPGYDPASGKGYSPLVLDLDGNGIHTTAITVSRTYYDLDNDGMAELVGWSDGKDGFLTYDRDGDIPCNQNDRINSTQRKAA